MVQKSLRKLNPTLQVDTERSCLLSAPFENLTRTQKRTRISEMLRELFNSQRRQNKFSRMPNMPWDQLFKRMNREIVFPTGLTLDIVYKVQRRTQGSDKYIQPLFEALATDSIVLRRIESNTQPTECRSLGNLV